MIEQINTSLKVDQNTNEYRIKYSAQHLQVEIVGEAEQRSCIQYENLLRKKESRLTRISISIVWLFIICHVWKLIPTIYELLYSEVSKIQNICVFVL